MSESDNATVESPAMVFPRGHWVRQSNGSTLYIGDSDADAESQSSVPHRHGIALTKHSLIQGKAACTVELSGDANSPLRQTSGGLLIGYASSAHPYVAATLGGFDRAYSIVWYEAGTGGWRSLIAEGVMGNLKTNRPYRLEVIVRGQTIALSVDGISVAEVVTPVPLAGNTVGFYAYGDRSVAFSNLQVHAERPKLFVMMPFSEPFDSLYTEVIAGVAKEHGFDVERADTLEQPGNVVEDIHRQVRESNAVVAEISRHNPNVFYELGYASALEKPAVLLCRKSESVDLPFDVRTRRVVFYDDTIAGKKKVEERLRAQLVAIRRHSLT